MKRFSALLLLFSFAWIRTSAAVYTDQGGDTSTYYSIYGYVNGDGSTLMNGGAGDPLDSGSPGVRETQIINGAVFTVDETNAGTGTFSSFLRVQNNIQERGMNATSIANNNNNDEKTDNNSTRDLQISQIPINTLMAGEYGVPTTGQYLEIRLDMNEDQNGTLPENTIFTELQFWVSSSQITTPYQYDNGVDPLGHPDETNRDGDNDSTTSSLGTLLWDLDAGEDRALGVYQSNSGSGQSDMIFFIPIDGLIGLSTDSFLTMWVELDDTDSAGFEEFNLIDLNNSFTGVDFLNPGTPVIPEVGTFWLSTIALVASGVGLQVFRRKSR